MLVCSLYFSKMGENPAVFPGLCFVSPKHAKMTLDVYRVLSHLSPGTQQKRTGLPRLLSNTGLISLTLQTSQLKPIFFFFFF